MNNELNISAEIQKLRDRVALLETLAQMPTVVQLDAQRIAQLAAESSPIDSTTAEFIWGQEVPDANKLRLIAMDGALIMLNTIDLIVSARKCTSQQAAWALCYAIAAAQTEDMVNFPPFPV